MIMNNLIIIYYLFQTFIESSGIAFCYSCSEELNRITSFKTKCLDALKVWNRRSQIVKAEPFGDTELETFDEIKSTSIADNYEQSDFDWPDGEENYSDDSTSVRTPSVEEQKIKKPNKKLRKIKSEEPKISKKGASKAKKRKSSALSQDNEDRKGKICTVCGFEYTSTQIKHLLAEHGKKRTDLPEAEKAKDGFLIECNVCQKILSDKKTFRAHFILHSKLPELLQCPYCEEKFNDFGKHKYHIQKHENPWFECTFRYF